MYMIFYVRLAHEFDILSEEAWINNSNHAKKLVITISIIIVNQFTIRLNKLKKRNILEIY